MWRNLVARRLWEPKGAGSNPAIPICPCDVIGKHRLLKISVLQVRDLSGVLGVKPKCVKFDYFTTQIVISQLL